MNCPTLPTPFEIASIAAMLPGRMAIEKPSIAAHKALLLWHASTNVLNEEQGRRDEMQRQREEEELDDYLAKRPPETPEIKLTLKPDSEGISEAMEWVNSHAEKRDQFKSFTLFRKALNQFGRVYGPIFTILTTEEAARFISWRQDERRAADTKSKENRRAQSRSSDMLSNKSSQIVAGKQAQARRKKS